jgi:hypothetical protein
MEYRIIHDNPLYLKNATCIFVEKNEKMEMILITRTDLENLIVDKVRYCLLNYLPEPKPTDPEETEILCDKRESAKLLNCSVSTIDAMRRNGTLEPIYIGGRKGAVRFRKSDLLKIVNK